MNALFGDATTAMPTPASQAQSSLLSGPGSPSSLNIGQHGADSAIPGLDIDPPKVQIEDGKPILSRRGSEASAMSGKEGVGGWISSMVSRARNRGGDTTESSSRSGRYERVGDEER